VEHHLLERRKIDAIPPHTVFARQLDVSQQPFAAVGGHDPESDPLHAVANLLGQEPRGGAMRDVLEQPLHEAALPGPGRPEYERVLLHHASICLWPLILGQPVGRINSFFRDQDDRV
jgi:hypothetical protein